VVAAALMLSSPLPVSHLDGLCGLRYLAVPYGVLIGGGLGLAIGIKIGKDTWEPVL